MTAWLDKGFTPNKEIIASDCFTRWTVAIEIFVQLVTLWVKWKHVALVATYCCPDISQGMFASDALCRVLAPHLWAV